ncbi:patatin-like phospholipase family protein [Alsobacter sp. SYSU M60028]|uniref:Patatin-like phospholipase family protein n=1 Tax=Alsobacter ponti TaxID=2962936 RepID=A0ABT1LG18_9HYPH|nr:patatin-like phospholipase family protein [Alsobacter ponti]MCP8939198.1 patatin-like phospholipase family protein [Alsobacter ponti]
MPHRLHRAEPPDHAVALALGGGGARGLAHLVVLETLDELGVRPTRIIGTSMGAIVGAAYASGVSGKDLRKYALERLRDRGRVMALLLQARVGKLTDLFQRGFGNPVLVDAEKFLDLFWPEAVPDLFEELSIRFSCVATDYYARCDALFDSGPLVTGVAASMAVPGLVRPVVANGRVYIDGGATNPLPFDHLDGGNEVIVAVDVAGGTVETPKFPPEPMETLFGASLIMQGAIVAEKLKARAPDVLVRPAVDGFRGLDFFKAKAILQAAEPVREALKRQLDAAIGAAERGLTDARRRSS